jgi:hypothetical protein
MAKPRVKIKKDGISTFIATLLLMVLAVSAGVVIYAYTMGYLGGFGGPQTMGAISLDTHNFADGTHLQVYVRNIGKTTFELQSVYIDGVSYATFTPLIIDENEVSSTTITYAAGFGTITHVVKLVGVDNTQISFNAKSTHATGGTVPTVSVAPVGPLTMNVGQTQVFTATPSGGTAPYSYKWYLDTVEVVGQTAATYTYTAALGSHSVYSTVTDSASTPVTVQSNTVSVTVSVAPQQVTYVSAGTGSGLTSGNPTPTYPGSLQANDLILLQVVVRTDTSVTITPPAGFTLLYGPDATQGGNSRVTQWIYYKFSTGTESGTATVTITGSVDRAARMYAFRNVALTSFTEGASFGYGEDDVILAQPVTTLGTNRLAVSFVIVNSNVAVGSFTGESGGDWTEATTEFTFNGDDDLCMQLQTATMPTAGTISNGSYDTGSTSYRFGVRAFALIP